jgi:RimJ/RimL family protein N-acetyltransferase
MKIVLETARLLLRELTPDDLDFTEAMLADEETMRFYPQRYSRADAEAWVRRQIDRYARDGHGLWLVLRKETTMRPVGHVGLVNMLVEGEILPETGYLIHRPFWRHGFASEAALAVRDYAFGALGKPFVIAQIREINVPSQGVARKLGMRRVKLNLHAGLEHMIWRVDRVGGVPPPNPSSSLQLN